MPRPGLAGEPRTCPLRKRHGIQPHQPRTSLEMAAQPAVAGLAVVAMRIQSWLAAGSCCLHTVSCEGCANAGVFDTGADNCERHGRVLRVVHSYAGVLRY